MFKQAIKGEAFEELLLTEIERRAAPSGRPGAVPKLATSATAVRFEEWLRAAQESATSVGKMPPASATWRARLGAILVRIVRRMLFWYTPQIVGFNTASVGAIRAHHNLISEWTSDLNAQIAALRMAQVELASKVEELQQSRARIPRSAAVFEAADPEAVCRDLEARGYAELEVIRRGPGKYTVIARKPATAPRLCES